jgi:hypothetical protein
MEFIRVSPSSQELSVESNVADKTREGTGLSKEILTPPAACFAP